VSDARAGGAAGLSFELTLSGGPLERAHRQAVGDLEQLLPWSTLEPGELEPWLLARARGRWTECAFNEHRSGILMAQLVQALGEAQVPLDLWSLACGFPLQELAHAELCARVASRLGGGQDIETATLEMTLTPSAGLTPRQRCHELVVRLCCVGETISRHWLAGMRERVEHPLVHGVLSRLLRDEALHSGFGWLYLGWCRQERLLDEAERSRLSALARAALDGYRARPAGDDVVGARIPHDVLVALPAAEYRRTLVEAGKEVSARLAEHGLDPGRA
jgi:hypothetical protein